LEQAQELEIDSFSESLKYLNLTNELIKSLLDEHSENIDVIIKSYKAEERPMQKNSLFEKIIEKYEIAKIDDLVEIVKTLKTD
jgi:hypothetical protein